MVESFDTVSVSFDQLTIKGRVFVSKFQNFSYLLLLIKDKPIIRVRLHEDDDVEEIIDILEEIK